MKSTALRFGRATQTWLSAFYGFAWSAMVMAGLLAGAGLVFLIVMGIAGAQLGWQIMTLDIDDADNCLARFRSNRAFGLLVFAALTADMVAAAVS